MGLFDRFFKNNNFMQRFNVTYMKNTGDRRAIPKPSAYSERLDKLYYPNQAVQACVAARQRVSEAPLGVNVNGKIVYNHPITKLLERPNPDMSYSQLMQLTEQYTSTAGWACWVKQRYLNSDTIKSIYPLSGGVIVPIPAEFDGLISHYVVRQGNKEIVIAARDVILFQSDYIKPDQPWLAVSPLEMASEAILTYNELTRWVYEMAESAGMPRVLTMIPEDSGIDPDKAKQYTDQLNQRARENAGRFMVTAKQDIIQMSSNLGELDITKLIAAQEVKICGTFRVDTRVAMTNAGMQSSTYANYETAVQDFARSTLVPLWAKYQETIRRGFSVDGYSDEFVFDLSQVGVLQPTPSERRASTISAYTAGIIPINVAQQEMGYSIVNETERSQLDDSMRLLPLYTAGTITLNELRAGSGLPALTSGDVFYTPPVSGAFSLPVSSSVSGKIIPDKTYDVFWQKTDAAKRAYQADLDKDLQEHFLELGSELKKSKTGKRYKFSFSFNTASVVSAFMRKTAPKRNKYTQSVLGEMLTDLDSTDLFSVNSLFDEVQAGINKNINDQITQATESFKQMIQNAIDAESGNNLTTDELAARLNQRVKDLSITRAKVVSQTTTTAQTAQAQIDGGKKINARETAPKRKLVKVWITRRDGSVRPKHKDRDGDYVELDGQFSGGIEAPGLGGQASDDINCRCVIRTVRAGNLNG